MSAKKHSSKAHSHTSDMAHPLYLTKNEAAAFAGLPDGIKEGWQIHDETVNAKDTADKRAIRISLMRLQDPVLKDFQEKAHNAKTNDEFLELVKATDLTKLHDGDLAELLFVLGPVGVTDLIAILFSQAKTDTDLDGIASLSAVRHAMIESMSSAS